MQTVAAGWTAEERDSVRKIVQSTMVSWKKDSLLSNRTFTIGVSTIGGNDIIGINPGAIGSPGNYRYFDDTDNVISIAWERQLNMPTGGLTKALADIELDNTSNRYTPRYMGGNSELHTAILPRRPVVISAGFNYGGVDQTLPQFAGVTTKSPNVDVRSRRVSMQAADYVDFFQNRFVDQTTMFTSQFTDQVVGNIFSQLGMSTAQYDLDPGINLIPFGMYEKGTRVSHILNQLAEAENGHIYQDEEGIFHFDNRQHWDSAPYDSVQRVVLTSQVLNAEAPDEDHIVNVVEITAPIREKQPLQTIFSLPTLTSIEVPANSSVEKFFEFEDPVLALTDPTAGGANSFYIANSQPDGTGTDKTSNVTFTNLGTFATAVKYRITNNSSPAVHLTQLALSGRIAKHVSDLYYRERDDSSVTAYEERPLLIDNPYIQSESWAESYAKMLLADFSDIESLQRITIRAIPELQLGDLISWQGRYWRIYNIRARLDATTGFIQELTLLQRTITTYFRIGISTIGGSDQIAP